MTRSDFKPFRIISLVSAFSLFSLPALALDAYQATYTANIKSGLNFNGKLKRSLTQTEDGRWLFKDNISSMLASIEESSLFSLEGNQIKPATYHYLRKVIGKRKKNDIDFDWKQMSATNIDGKTFKLIPGTQDALSYQMQLQIDLKNGKRGNLSYPITKKDRLDTIKFSDQGNEKIDTPLGTFDTIKMKIDRGENAKRTTYIWIAPEKNFIITKLHQTEPDGKSYSIILEKLQ